MPANTWISATILPRQRLILDELISYSLAIQHRVHVALVGDHTNVEEGGGHPE
jgi:hypothetical protein